MALFDLRVLFYLITPFEAYQWEDYKDVPDFLHMAIGYCTAMILVEIFVSCATHRIDKSHSFYDAIASLSCVVLFTPFKSLSLTIGFRIYDYIHHRYKLINFECNSTGQFIVELIMLDFLRYWSHRFCHDINFVWALHKIHHSSSHYNLFSSMRNSVFQEFVFVPLYSSLALFIPTQHFCVHMALSSIYPFWLHTELIPKLGWMEYVLVTPSHHRVHHARNSSHNYSNLLIIWDRLFGTFFEEIEGKPIVYATGDSNTTYNMVKLQVSNKFWAKLCSLHLPTIKLNLWKQKSGFWLYCSLIILLIVIGYLVLFGLQTLLVPAWIRMLLSTALIYNFGSLLDTMSKRK